MKNTDIKNKIMKRSKNIRYNSDITVLITKIANKKKWYTNTKKKIVIKLAKIGINKVKDFPSDFDTLNSNINTVGSKIMLRKTFDALFHAKQEVSKQKLIKQKSSTNVSVENNTIPTMCWCDDIMTPSTSQNILITSQK